MPTPLGRAPLLACPAVQPYHTGSSLPVAHQANSLFMQTKTAVNSIPSDTLHWEPDSIGGCPHCRDKIALRFLERYMPSAFFFVVSTLLIV